MGDPVIDRRVTRSRTALFDALLSLMLEEDYQSISIEDILTRADIGRSTFYAHFISKDDLLEKSLERLAGRPSGFDGAPGGGCGALRRAQPQLQPRLF